MKKIIAVTLIAMAIIICSAGCVSKNDEVAKVPCLPIAEKETKTTQPKTTQAKPEIMWTAGIGEIRRVGDSLVSSVTIRPLSSNEKTDFVFKPGTEIIPEFIDYGSDGCSAGTSGGIFKDTGTHQIEASKFFNMYTPINRNDTMVNVKIVIRSAESGEIIWDGYQAQQFPIK